MNPNLPKNAENAGLNMEIRETRRALPARTELKVSVPTELRIRLHAIKVLHGVNIADIVEVALTRYLDEMKGRGAAALQASLEHAAERASPVVRA